MLSRKRRDGVSFCTDLGPFILKGGMIHVTIWFRSNEVVIRWIYRHCTLLMHLSIFINAPPPFWTLINFTFYKCIDWYFYNSIVFFFWMYVLHSQSFSYSHCIFYLNWGFLIFEIFIHFNLLHISFSLTMLWSCTSSLEQIPCAWKGFRQ